MYIDTSPPPPPPPQKYIHTSRHADRFARESNRASLPPLVTLAILAAISLLIGLSFWNVALNLGEDSTTRYHPHEPPLSGIFPGVERPHIILAQDIDYPPYAFLDSSLQAAGVGFDIATQLHKVCDIDVTVVETRWKNCWAAGEIGEGLLNGWYHGCMTYTHTAGQRNRFVDFSEPILDLNKPGGLLVRLDANGAPLLSGSVVDLKGKKIVDVVGWAPTADGLFLVENTCAEGGPSKFENIEYVAATEFGSNPNDNALLTMLNGTADAVWIYADQAKNYKCDDTKDQTKWNCKLWDGGDLGYGGFGQPNGFAYIHTGMFGYAHGGTTLSLHKKGSRLSDILDPCIKKFKKTKEYYEVCKENDLVHSCFDNDFFPADKQAGGAHDHKAPYETLTRDLKVGCEDGYCKCPGSQ